MLSKQYLFGCCFTIFGEYFEYSIILITSWIEILPLFFIIRREQRAILVDTLFPTHIPIPILFKKLYYFWGVYVFILS